MIRANQTLAARKLRYRFGPVPMRLRLAILVSSIALGACTTTPPELLPPPFGPDTSSPQRARLFWPTGLAMHPRGHHLLVANANFDHAFAGGAIYSLDVDALLAQRGTVPFSPTFLRQGNEGAAMVGNYLGPLVLEGGRKRHRSALREER